MNPHTQPSSKAPGRTRRLPSGQRGVVLVISLILIVILSLLGTLAIRNATQSERSINGVRTTQVSREAAETALRFCEQIAIFDSDNKDYSEWGTTGLRAKIVTTTIASEQDTAAAWRSANNWKTGSTSLIEVPATYFKKYVSGSPATDAAQLLLPPRCIIQRIETTSTPVLRGYLITARGFANTAKFDGSTGKATQGAETWLQSILTKN